MSIISDDGVYSWDGEKWVEINHENEEEEVYQRPIYIPTRKKLQPPDWDVEEAAYTEANYQFIQTEVSKKYNDDDRHKLMVNLFIWIGFFICLLNPFGLVLMIVWLVITPVTVPIFNAIRRDIFRHKEHKFLKSAASKLIPIYEEVFEKQMNESNIEMKERQEMLSNLEEHYELG